MGNGAVFYMYNVVRHGGEGAVVGYHNHGNALLAAGILQKLQYGLTGELPIKENLRFEPDTEDILLIPMGAARLRISAFQIYSPQKR